MEAPLLSFLLPMKKIQRQPEPAPPGKQEEQAPTQPPELLWAIDRTFLSYRLGNLSPGQVLGPGQIVEFYDCYLQRRASSHVELFTVRIGLRTVYDPVKQTSYCMKREEGSLVNRTLNKRTSFKIISKPGLAGFGILARDVSVYENLTLEDAYRYGDQDARDDIYTPEMFSAGASAWEREYAHVNTPTFWVECPKTMPGMEWRYDVGGGVQHRMPGWVPCARILDEHLSQLWLSSWIGELSLEEALARGISGLDTDLGIIWAKAYSAYGRDMLANWPRVYIGMDNIRYIDPESRRPKCKVTEGTRSLDDFRFQGCGVKTPTPTNIEMRPHAFPIGDLATQFREQNAFEHREMRIRLGQPFTEAEYDRWRWTHPTVVFADSKSQQEEEIDAGDDCEHGGR